MTQIRVWTDDEREALDEAREHARKAENWIDELEANTFGDECDKICHAQALAYRLHSALVELDKELKARDEAAEAEARAQA